jgi:hypothetical protein
VPWYLDRALNATSNLFDVRKGVVSFADLTGLIASRNPLGARIGWTEGGGHFVVLHGWKKTTTGDEYVDVADPDIGSSTLLYEPRFLEIPGLNATAVWLRNLEGNEDLIIPVDPVPRFLRMKAVYTPSDFLDHVRPAASKRLQFEDAPSSRAEKT